MTEGAIQAALVAIFALATRYIPVLGLATAFFVPLPLAVLVIRRGLLPALLAAGVAGVIAGLLAGPLAGGGLLLTFAPIGVALGWGARSGWKASSILLLTSVVVVASLAVNLVLTLALSGVNPYTIMIESMQQGQEAALAFYQRLGINTEALRQTNQQIMQVLALLPKLLPVLILQAGVFIAWLNFQVARTILRRLGIPLPALPPASTWRLPSFMVWLLPLALILAMLGGPLPQGAPAPDATPPTGAAGRTIVPPEIGLNLLYLLQTLFAVQGVIVAWVLLGRYTSVAALRIMVLVFLLVNPLLSRLLFLLGLADSVFPLRERFGPRRAVTEGRA
ncbi:MAG TPA: DUF2232 domain-containing protein [bacterium]|nr:DUF2232 domain-containing protein [bacterium]